MELINYLQPGWNLRLGRQRLIVDAPSELAAYELLLDAAEQLALSVANLNLKEACISWEGCQRPLRVLAAMASSTSPKVPDVPDIVFSKQIGLDTFELNVLERMRSSAKPMSICDLETDDQEWGNAALAQMLQMSSDRVVEQNMRDYWEEDALAYVKRVLRQQGTFDHSYEAMLPFSRAQFSSTFETIEFGHPKRFKRLVTIHSYEPLVTSAIVF